VGTRLKRWWRYPFAVAGPLSVLVWTSIAVAGIVGALTLRRPFDPVPALLVSLVSSAGIKIARKRFAESRGITSAELRQGLRRQNVTGLIIAAFALGVVFAFDLKVAWGLAIGAVCFFVYELDRRQTFAAALGADPRWARDWSPEIDPAYEFVATRHFLTKEYDKARELLEKGLERNPKGFRRSFALYNLACAEALLDNGEAALQHLSAAAEEAFFRKYAQGSRLGVHPRRPSLPVLSEIFWLGGMSGVGKTTAARALARRHDLRLYSFDAHQFEHASRLPPETRTLDEIWVDTTPEELADWFEERCRERFGRR